MSIHRRTVDKSKLNRDAALPYDLRLIDFESAMQDVYDFFYDVNLHLATLHADGVAKLRRNWVYLDPD